MARNQSQVARRRRTGGGVFWRRRAVPCFVRPYTSYVSPMCTFHSNGRIYAEAMTDIMRHVKVVWDWAEDSTIRSTNSKYINGNCGQGRAVSGGPRLTALGRADSSRHGMGMAGGWGGLTGPRPDVIMHCGGQRWCFGVHFCCVGAAQGVSCRRSGCKCLSVG